MSRSSVLFFVDLSRHEFRYSEVPTLYLPYPHPGFRVESEGTVGPSTTPYVLVQVPSLSPIVLPGPVLTTPEKSDP